MRVLVTLAAGETILGRDEHRSFREAKKIGNVLCNVFPFGCVIKYKESPLVYRFQSRPVCIERIGLTGFLEPASPFCVDQVLVFWTMRSPHGHCHLEIRVGKTGCCIRLAPEYGIASVFVGVAVPYGGMCFGVYARHQIGT